MAAGNGEKRIHVGTSGWTYDDWSGTFYPKAVKGSERLAYYVECFNSVEVNATFYRVPSRAMIDAWNRRLGPEFHLAVKGHRSVTHIRELRHCRKQLESFLDRVLQLKRLKVILWQLPPTLEKDMKRLARFLAMLPDDVRHAVEFRHSSWWDEDVTSLLADHSTAMATISHPRLPRDITPTTDFLYLRFHGQGRRVYKYDYSGDELREWATNLEPHLRDRPLYAFFNNDAKANAPRNAQTFRELIGTS